MIINKKIIPKFLTFFMLLGCSNNFTYNLKEEYNSKKQEQENNYIFDIGKGKKGASFSTKIKFEEKLRIKSNINGSVAKLISDIYKVDAYLLELDSFPTTGSDPLSSIVNGGAILNIKRTGSSFSIMFKNVPINNSGKKYFVGLVAKDLNGNIISKNPTPDWTGTSTNKGLAITNSGGDGSGFVTVNSSYQLSSTLPLTASIALLDAVGAQIDSTATIVNGGLPPIVLAE